MKLPSLSLALAFACAPAPYATCDLPSDCLVPDEVEAACLDKDATLSFCTWACEDDAGCLDFVEGYAGACASFESEAGTYCFPECGASDACPPGYGCRSTGGGSDNRKVCFPS